MEETLKYKIDIDDSSISQKIQQVNMMAQQQAMMLGGSYQQMGGQDYGQQMAQAQAMNMAATAGYQGFTGLDPRTVFAQTAYNAGISQMGPLQAGLSGLYGEQTTGPRFTSPYSYQYPRGFIPGQPQQIDYSPRGFFGNMNRLAGTAIMSGFGMNPHGLHGGALDEPMYRHLQEMGEGPAKQLAAGASRVGEGVLGAGMVAGTLAATFGMGFIPGTIAATGLYEAHQALAPMIRGPREYLDIGEYFRDVTAPSIRSGRLGGGPSGEQVQEFQRGFSRLVADDKRFTRDDYSNIMRTAGDQGMFQTANDPEKVLKVIENVGKNLKVYYALGGKIKETNAALEQLSQMGVSMGSNTDFATRFMTTLSLSAFQSGQTMASMMPGMAQAGQLFAQQGMAPSLGAQIHAQSAAVAGEAIRSGGFTQDSLAYYGGQQGITDSITRVYGGVNRSPIGNLMNMSLMNDPRMINKMSGMNMGGLIGNMMGFSDPSKYMELQMRMPDMTRKLGELNPNAFGTDQMSALMTMMAQSMGKQKLDIGEFYHLLQQPAFGGATPQDARAYIATLENAPKAYESARQSALNKAGQIELETIRGNSILTPEGMRNKMESLFEKSVGNMGASLQGMMDKISDNIQRTVVKMTTGKDIINTGGGDMETKNRNYRNLISGREDVVDTTQLKEDAMLENYYNLPLHGLIRSQGTGTARGNIERARRSEPVRGAIASGYKGGADSNLEAIAIKKILNSDGGGKGFLENILGKRVPNSKDEDFTNDEFSLSWDITPKKPEIYHGRIVAEAVKVFGENPTQEQIAAVGSALNKIGVSMGSSYDQKRSYSIIKHTDISTSSETALARIKSEKKLYGLQGLDAIHFMPVGQEKQVGLANLDYGYGINLSSERNTDKLGFIDATAKKNFIDSLIKKGSITSADREKFESLLHESKDNVPLGEPGEDFRNVSKERLNEILKQSSKQYGAAAVEFGKGLSDREQADIMLNKAVVNPNDTLLGRGADLRNEVKNLNKLDKELGTEQLVKLSRKLPGLIGVSADDVSTIAEELRHVGGSGENAGKIYNRLAGQEVDKNLKMLGQVGQNVLKGVSTDKLKEQFAAALKALGVSDVVEKGRTTSDLNDDTFSFGEAVENDKKAKVNIRTTKHILGAVQEYKLGGTGTVATGGTLSSGQGIDAAMSSVAASFETQNQMFQQMIQMNAKLNPSKTDEYKRFYTEAPGSLETIAAQLKSLNVKFAQINILGVKTHP